jgi:geranylgeranyl pyrophosphate synthase
MVEETERYGLKMGIAFQMVDDILDITGHAELLGKPTGMDLRDGNPSLPIILALNANQLAVCEAFEQNQPQRTKSTALAAIKMAGHPGG